jgi:hypothetical protein
VIVSVLLRVAPAVRVDPDELVVLALPLAQGVGDDPLDVLGHVDLLDGLPDVAGVLDPGADVEVPAGEGPGLDERLVSDDARHEPAAAASRSATTPS